MTSATHHLDCATTAPQHARDWLSAELAMLPATQATTDLIHDAQLCASELVTNAVAAGCLGATIRLLLTETQLRLSVIDDALGDPVLSATLPDAEHGRGLMLIAAISERWGVDPAAGGKEIWVELRREA